MRFLLVGTVVASLIMLNDAWAKQCDQNYQCWGTAPTPDFDSSEILSKKNLFGRQLQPQSAGHYTVSGRYDQLHFRYGRIEVSLHR